MAAVTQPSTGLPSPGGRVRTWPRSLALAIGAVVFLFPFYYMAIGSLQAVADPSVGAAFDVTGLTLDNYREINGRVDLLRSLLNSGIFTGAVIVSTVVFGVLAGYALARLHWRGKGSLFALLLLVQVVPFQLLVIPLYVMIVRSYGLADSYLGMILPFAINSTAVFVFRQFFLQLPEDLFAAARIDGAGEIRILWSIALPLVRPALLTVVLLTFIGPWNWRERWCSRHRPSPCSSPSSGTSPPRISVPGSRGERWRSAARPRRGRGRPVRPDGGRFARRPARRARRPGLRPRSR